MLSYLFSFHLLTLISSFFINIIGQLFSQLVYLKNIYNTTKRNAKTL